jgi:hypothetical protein
VESGVVPKAGPRPEYLVRFKIFGIYFGGDTWVDKESPVVTTDPRITARMAQLGL